MTLSVRAIGTHIANQDVQSIFTPSVDMPAWLGRCNLKGGFSSLVDISGAGASFVDIATGSNRILFNDSSVLVSRTYGIRSNINARAAVSVYSVHAANDMTQNLLAFPFGDISWSTSGAGYGTGIRERYPRGSNNVMYCDGRVYHTAGDGTASITLNSSDQNVNYGDFVFRMLVINPDAYTATIYSGYRGVFVKTVTQIPKNLANRDLTHVYDFGYNPNTETTSGASPTLLMSEIGVFAGACTDKQAARAYSDARALNALKGIIV